MTSTSTYNIASKYETVRKHLDCLGYKQALSLEALPLIENLVSDLIKTTESLKHYKNIARDHIEACNQLQSIVDPYKYDNAKLVQECNELHTNLIENQENHQKQIKSLKKLLYKLESEYNDLQLSSSRNLQKIKDLELESSKKSKKILELQGRCGKPIFKNVVLASKKQTCYPLRRPVLECTNLSKVSSTFSLPSLTTVEPKAIDLINMADHRMNCLNREVTKLKGDLSTQSDNVYTLQEQLTAKEKEILRLRKMLEGGKPFHVVTNDYQCKKVHATGPCDNSELLMLQQAKLDLEQQLKETLDKQHDAMARAVELAERNEELEKELKDIDYIALAVEADCNSVIKENIKRVSQLQEKLESVLTQVHVLENELIVERRESQELKADLEASRLDNRNIQRMLESALDEKKRITDQINQATIIEKSLNDEIQRLSKENERLKLNIVQLECMTRLLKEDGINSNHKTNDSKSGSSGEQNLNSPPIRNNHFDKDTKRNEFTRDSNAEFLRTNAETQQCNRGRDPIPNNADVCAEICDLKRQLNEKEHALICLKREKEELSREKMSLETCLQSYKNRHKKSCTCSSPSKPYETYPCASSSSPETDANRTKVLLERLERERNIARADVEYLTEERDALRERLKGTRKVSGLEDQMEDLREELKRTKQELASQRTQYFQLRALQDQTDQALEDLQGQLVRSETELNKMMDCNKSVEQQRRQLDNQVQNLKLEIANLRSNTVHLDQEKDQLLVILDKKTENMAALENELHVKAQQINEMDQQIRNLERKSQICVDQNADKERQLRTVQIEMESLQHQLNTASMDRENAIQENKRLQDDLAAVTCEVRNLQRELEASHAEAFDLKKQLQTYVSEVRRAEELLNRKENERTEMLNHFRSLSLEATVLENNNHSLESEAAEARSALQSTRDQLLDLERQLTDRDCLMRGYEAQIAELTQNIASMETQLRQQADDRQRAEADLHAVRDLCVKLDQQKDSLMQQIEDKDLMKSQYDSQLARLKAEQNVIQDQMKCDRAAMDRLEDLLDQAKQESMETQMANQELQNEVARLKHKIADLHSKLSAESADVRRYQDLAAEYSRQINELRRQVTNERFDRARKDEESRRSLNSTPDSFNVDSNVVI